MAVNQSADSTITPRKGEEHQESVSQEVGLDQSFQECARKKQPVRKKPECELVFVLQWKLQKTDWDVSIWIF